jgi:hypothetical protein
VSSDYNWLKDKGYHILSNVATYIVSVARYDENTATYYFEDSVGVNGLVSEKHQAFTNNFAKLALRYAIEASYECKQDVSSNWHDVYEGLVILKWPNTIDNTMIGITKYDENAQLTDSYKVLDVLFTFMPNFWEEELNMASDRVLFYKTIQNNLNFYSARQDVSDVTRPVNLALQTIISGVCLSQNSTLLTDFNSKLQSFIDHVIYGPWYYMRADSRILPAIGESLVRAGLQNNTSLLKTSLHSYAMFLSIILQGLAQARLVGGVGENRFHYTDFKIQTNNSAVLPYPWAFVSFQNIGMNSTATSVDTRQSDLGSSASNVPSGSNITSGVSGGSSSIFNFHIYTP